MPYTMRKVNKKNCYRVSNRKTRKVFAKCATKRDAKKQLRLLRAIQYNPKFKLRPRS
jgi:Leu/Phe-tRNA-protein transferase